MIARTVQLKMENWIQTKSEIPILCLYLVVRLFYLSLCSISLMNDRLFSQEMRFHLSLSVFLHSTSLQSLSRFLSFFPHHPCISAYAFHSISFWFKIHLSVLCIFPLFLFRLQKWGCLAETSDCIKIHACSYSFSYSVVVLLVGRRGFWGLSSRVWGEGWCLVSMWREKGRGLDCGGVAVCIWGRPSRCAPENWIWEF